MFLSWSERRVQSLKDDNEIVFEDCGDGGSHRGIFTELERVWRGQCRGIDWVGFLQGMGDLRETDGIDDFRVRNFCPEIWHLPSTTDLSRWRSEFRFAAKLSARLASQRSGHLFAKASTSRHNHIAAASDAGRSFWGGRDIVEASLLGERQRCEKSLDGIEEKRQSNCVFALSLCT